MIHMNEPTTQSLFCVFFGPVTGSEINIMLTAAMEGGDTTAGQIMSKCEEVGKRWKFVINRPQAEYLVERLLGDADRVSQACGDAAGRAFEKAGEKLERLIECCEH